MSSEIFLTCHHVINNKESPHQDGDAYQLVNNLTGASGVIHQINNGRIGENIHLFPDSDLALLVSRFKKDQAYARLDYGDIAAGLEIGVAGYPLPRLIVNDGELTYEGLIYRVAKGVVASFHEINLTSDQGIEIKSAPLIEVNFLFVPGNSGGPIFHAETGRVVGFVHGYRTDKIRETVERATLINNIPDGVSETYIDSLSALYSLGIKLNHVRPFLEKFNVSL